MAKRRKKLTPNQQAYNQQVNRIKRAYRELEKQGYRIEKPVSDFIPDSRPNRVTGSVLNKLKSVTRSSLRKVSTALNEFGKPVSGTEVFKQHRSRSAQRAAETRKYLKWLESTAGQAYLRSETEQEWEQKRREKDKEQKRKASKIHATDIILTNVEALIDKYDTVGGTYLRKALNHEINKYGRDAIAQAMEEAPRYFIQATQDIIFYQERMSSYETTHAIGEFIDIIRGNIPSDEEQRELGEIQEQMGAFENPD